MKCHNTLKRLIQNLYLIISFVVIPVKSHQAIQQLPLTIHFTFGGVSILPHDDRTIPYMVIIVAEESYPTLIFITIIVQ